ncbi:hypothetical protein FRB99_007197, partial [Tulasnella sp. 403]
ASAKQWLDRVVEILLPGETEKKKINLPRDGRPVDVSGDFSDIYRGSEGSIGSVALKRLRETNKNPTKEHKNWFEEEKRHWESLQHDHILPLLGIGEDGDKFQYFVTPWMDHGSLWDHVKRNPSCDRPRYLREIASALAYIHEKELIHGDINAQNILISKENCAKLCDFGLSKYSKERTVGGLTATGPLRFQSPELLTNGRGKSKKSDVYAFGMTIYQVLSGQFPFAHYKAQKTICEAVRKRNERPPCQPEIGLTGQSYAELWEVAKNCWQKDRTDRPSMNDVHRQLQVSGSSQTNENPAADPPGEQEVLPTPEQPVTAQSHQDTVPPSPTTHAPIYPLPFPSQLISMLATISESANVMTGVADLGGTIVFNDPSSIQFPPATSHNSTVYRASLNPSETVVAIKVLRTPDIEGSNELKRLAKKLVREIRVWKALKHRRITPLEGYAILQIGACLISPWCANGNVLQYLQVHPDVDRRSLVLQVAEGVVYLHTRNPPVIHADLKASNVLINDGGEAMLCDFGLSKFLGELPSKYATSSDQIGTMNHMAPELFEGANFTTRSDVYEFGCLTLDN